MAIFVFGLETDTSLAHISPAIDSISKRAACTGP
jgi:hypothetical protein